MRTWGRRKVFLASFFAGVVLVALLASFLRCTDCKGARTVVCPECRGGRWVTERIGPPTAECQVCSGTGQIGVRMQTTLREIRERTGADISKQLAYTLGKGRARPGESYLVGWVVGWPLSGANPVREQSDGTLIVFGSRPCDDCGGDGAITVGGIVSKRVPCRLCKQRGVVRCEKCRGHGWTWARAVK